VCSPSLSPRACLVQKRTEIPEIRVPWLIWNIDFTLTVDLPLIHGHISADVREKVSVPYRRLSFCIDTALKVPYNGLSLTLEKA